MSAIAEGLLNFRPVRTSAAPAFESTSGSTAALYALESTGVREFTHPSARALRFASKASNDLYVAWGTSDVVASTGTGVLILGGTVETFRISPSDTHMSVAATTDVVVNVCLGSGM